MIGRSGGRQGFRLPLAGMAEKKKEAAGLRVSTNVEHAWYVKPELLAGEEQGEAPEEELASEPDKTMNLDPGDLHEAPGELPESSEDARHYLGVSLRGAVLAADGEASDEDGGDPSLEGAPSAPALSASARLAAMARVVKERAVTLWQRAADAVAPVFEPGRVPPIVLAAVSFLAGVALTLLGVVIAL